jgi:crotonobetainyl-CoA:carnitine CoA-transferase CaiB-like acyl-CoA transferase
MRRLLSGVRIVEIVEGVPGAYCGKMFADLGAEVIKVEPPGGDVLRHDPRAPLASDGTRRGGSFLQFNTNKNSVVLDPSVPEDRKRLGDLLADADLAIEGRGASSLATYELDWSDLHQHHLGLSVLQMSGFGATGPYADYLWSDFVAQAVSSSLYPQPGAAPIKVPAHLGACMIGHFAALGGLAAVMAAQHGGEGSFIDCAAIEALSTQPRNSSFLLSLQYRDLEPAPQISAESLIPTGVFPCGDGHVAMMSTPQQLGEMLDVLDDDALRAAFARPDAFSRGDTKEVLDAALYPWLFSHTRAEITALAQAAGWPLAGVNLPHETLEADHLHQRGFWHHTDDPAAGSINLAGAPVQHAEAGWDVRKLAPMLDDWSGEHESSPAPAVPAKPRTAPTPPLAGVRVVDLTTVWAGPFATQMLGDLGAEVIRVENPFVLPPTTKGYTARPVDIAGLGAMGSMYGPQAAGRADRPWNRHAMNNCLCRNKLSVTMDTRCDEGRELVMRLIEKSDVFIENFKLSGLDSIGFPMSELQRRNPGLIITRMPPAGLTGEWSPYTGFGAQFDGLSSLAWLCGHPGTDPVTTPSTTYMDAASGPAAAFATAAALRYRDATGRGMVVDVAQVENVIGHLGDVFVDLQLGTEPQRMGNRDPLRSPQGAYPCRGDNQWIAITVADDEAWRSLTECMGRPELAADPRFETSLTRFDHHDEIDELIDAWTAQHDKYELFHQLQAARIAAGPVLDGHGFTTDPHVVERQWMRPLQSDDVGVHLHPGPAFSGGPHVWRHGSPTLGQDNEYVYKEILGVSDADYERYTAEKHIAVDYLDPDGNPY